MEPQDLVDRELQALKKRLCYISSTVCALCLVCLATTLALFLSRTKYCQSQTQGNCEQYRYQNITYARLKYFGTKNLTILWSSNGKINGMQHQDEKLIILSKGLYFINCRLHFLINKCIQNDHDLHTSLIVNRKPVYEVLNTVTNGSSCRIHRDQHLSLHIELNPFDNLSVETSYVEWINNESLAGSIVLEAFKL